MKPTPSLMRLLPRVLMGLTVILRVSAQGTFAFSNATLPGKPKIQLGDGTPIAGANYLVDVLVKDPVTGEFRDGLLRVTIGGVSAFAGVSPLTGNNAGLFSGGTLQVPFVSL